jgi:predicted ATPase/DNA-binding SARP family transcriptional activator
VEPVHVRVLGSLRLGDDDAVQPRSARLRKLLAVLLVCRGTVVSADRLAQAVWGDRQPADPLAALQNLVWRLRQALHAAGCEGAVRLLTRPPGYLLEVEAEQVDGVRFERQVRAAAAEPPERAVGLLEDALSLWRGPAYAEFADDEDIVGVEATRLEDLQLSARSDWVDALLALDRPGETLARLTLTVEADPLRERPRAQLMRALHRLGRTADALQIYREYRSVLAAELGLDPSPSLRNLQAAILQQRREPDRAPLAAERPGRPSRPPGNLRLELSDLVGRADEVAAAQAALQRSRVVTLSGVGGVGKTRLALRVGADVRPRYRDGAWVCELAGVADSNAVPDLVATTLGVQQRLDHTVTDRLVEYLRARSMLLLLDNCEHVLGAIADLVDTLVRDCADLTVLATSREPLGIDGERVLPVPPLPVPPTAMPGGAPGAAAVPSVALFCQRATAAAPTFALTEDNIAAVTEICRRLDGLPLALELAATRVRSLTPAEIADRLERRLSFLRSGRRIQEERHRTLASAVDWSYRLLTPGEQTVFDRCSVFMGSFTLAAAVAVVGESEPEVVDDVSGLVDKSMLVAHTDHAPVRFSMLETLRAYGRERLAERDEAFEACAAHATYHVELAEAADAGLRRADEGEWAQALAAAFDDLRRAHQWSLVHRPALAMRLSAALFVYGESGAPSEVPAWAARAAATAPQHPLLPVVLAAAAGTRFSGDLTQATAHAQHALCAIPENDLTRRYPLIALADVALFEGRLIDAVPLYKTSSDFAQAAGDAYFDAYSTAACSLPHTYHGDTKTAVRLAEQAKQLGTAIANPTVLAWAEYALGEAALLDDQIDEARAALGRAIAHARAARNRFVLGVILISIGSLDTRHGDPARAAGFLGEAIDYLSQAGNWTQQWITIRHEIDLLVRLGAHEQAAVLLGALTESATATAAYGPDAARLRSHAETLNTKLGAQRYSAAIERGAASNDHEIIQFARAEIDRVITAITETCGSSNITAHGELTTDPEP